MGLAIVAIIAALAGGAIVIGGPNVLTVDGGAVRLGAGRPGVIASLLVAGGTVAALASWIGALFNTARLDDKTWFVLLLVLGLWSFGFVAMVAYVVAGPDSTVAMPRVPAWQPLLARRFMNGDPAGDEFTGV